MLWLGSILENCRYIEIIARKRIIKKRVLSCQTTTRSKFISITCIVNSTKMQKGQIPEKGRYLQF